MRQYVVQPGDSPASIAAQDQHAGCMKCAIDLVVANPHKARVAHPNGFTTFRDLRAGEVLNLPDKWFTPAFDQLSPAYFKVLPFADGRTRGSIGALGDYPDLDVATGKVAALAAMDNATFASSAGDAGSAIDAAVKEVYGSTNAVAAQAAQNVQDGTQWAWQRNQALAAAIAAGDSATVTQARLDVQSALATALGNARVALNDFYGPSPATPGAPASGGGSAPVVVRPPSSYPAAVVSAAQAAIAAIAADSNYCTSVGRAGTAVNSAVHAFKIAWNASQSPTVPVGTGTYESATAAALGQVLGGAPPAACVGGVPSPWAAPPGSPVADDAGGGLSTAAVAGIAALGAVVVGGVAYVAMRPRRRSGSDARRRMTRRH